MRSVTIAFLAALAASVTTLAPAAAQQKTVLKLGWTSAAGETDPYAVGARLFKKELEARAGGRVEVQLFPNRQLGDEKPLLEGMRLGTVDAGIITNAVIAQIEPSFQINDLPFLFANEAQAQKLLDGPVGRKLADKLATKGVLALGYMEGGFRNMINNVRPVSKPEDVHGVKYRVMQNPVYIGMFSSLGGNAIPMAWGEVFTAVQQGTIDGLEIPLAVIDQNKMFEVTKYLSLTNHTYSMIGLLMSKRSFDRMPEDLRKATVEAGTAATRAQRIATGEIEQQTIKSLEAKGMKVNRIENPAAFRAAVTSVYDKVRDTVDAALMKEALAAVQ
ncbi:MAG: TRAP transporter substrate-binding protein [Alphaproteobacteria bacterium]|nr:TRAP transporter substrate-binding protein [Alphaproteobacteria bacterium]